MKYKDFRNFKIVRSCDKKYKTCNSYKPFLKKDFKNRCAYCNMLDEIVLPKEYETDHFIPRNTFKDIKPELEYTYDNLMYSCPKCNGKKSDEYEGDINSDKIENNAFYNPIEVDYNEVFYRNEYGGISSENKKGNQMIVKLNLYNPIHNLAWLIDEITEIEGKVAKKINDDGTNKERITKLKDADYRLLKYKDDLIKLFKANYYNSKWK